MTERNVTPTVATENTSLEKTSGIFWFKPVKKPTSKNPIKKSVPGVGISVRKTWDKSSSCDENLRKHNHKKIVTVLNLIDLDSGGQKRDHIHSYTSLAIDWSNY